MAKELTRQEITALLQELVEREGSNAAAARKIGVTRSFLGKVLNGEKLPGRAILKFFGIEREIIYTKK